MHMHCDRPGTGWVAIMNLGETSRFVFDHSYNCKRCFVNGKDRGGQGENSDQDHWYRLQCESCIPVNLESGDCILFYGCDSAHVAHGSLGTCKGIGLVSRVILFFDLNLYMPMSKVNENMKFANVRKAATEGLFHFRRNVVPLSAECGPKFRPI